MKRWVGTILYLVCCLLAIATNGAGSRSVDDLDGLAAELLADSSMPSIAIAAGGSQGLLALGAAGKRRVDDTLPVTRADRFHLGSDTKAMTAVLAATFVQEGKLEWASTLRELFPDLKTMHESYYEVTLAELLAHKSGLTGSIAGNHPDVWGRLWKNEGPVDEQRRWFVDTVLSEPPSTKPGKEYRYSTQDSPLPERPSNGSRERPGSGSCRSGFSIRSAWRPAVLAPRANRREQTTPLGATCTAPTARFRCRPDCEPTTLPPWGRRGPYIVLCLIGACSSPTSSPGCAARGDC